MAAKPMCVGVVCARLGSAVLGQNVEIEIRRRRYAAWVGRSNLHLSMDKQITKSGPGTVGAANLNNCKGEKS
jgi:hypothetical protein